MNNCKDCTFWTRSKSTTGLGVCDKVEDFLHKIDKDKTDQAFMDIEVNDDSGLISRFTTGENFGCTMFQPKQ